MQMNLFVPTVLLYLHPGDHRLLLTSFYSFKYMEVVSEVLVKRDQETLTKTLDTEFVALSFSMLVSFTIVLSCVLASIDLVHQVVGWPAER